MRGVRDDQMRQPATPILAMKTNRNFDNAARLLLGIAKNDLIGDLEAPFLAPKPSIAERNAPDPIKSMETFAQALTTALKGMTIGDDQRSTLGNTSQCSRANALSALGVPQERASDALWPTPTCHRCYEPRHYE